MKYTRKPIRVDAFEMKYEPAANLYWPDWFREAMFLPVGTPNGAFLHENGMFVIFPDDDGQGGLLEIGNGDFVVKEGGKLFVISPDKFHANYEFLSEY